MGRTDAGNQVMILKIRLGWMVNADRAKSAIMWPRVGDFHTWLLGNKQYNLRGAEAKHLCRTALITSSWTASSVAQCMKWMLSEADFNIYGNVFGNSHHSGGL